VQLDGGRGGAVVTIVEVVITVRVPEGTRVDDVADRVATWSAPLDAGVGWRVLAVEGVEPDEEGMR